MTKRDKKRSVKLTPRDLRILDSMKDNSWKEGCSSPREMVERATDVRGVGRLSMWMKTRTLPLTPNDWKRIVLLCTDAIVKKRHSNRSDRAQVDVLLPFNFRVMCPDFPRGYLMDVPDVLTLKYRVNANALLDYAYEKGYSLRRPNIYTEALDEALHYVPVETPKNAKTRTKDKLSKPIDPVQLLENRKEYWRNFYKFT